MPSDLSTAVPVEPIAADAAAVDEERSFPRAAIDELGRAGLLGLGLPESNGGAGSGPLEFVDVVEQIAGACASTGMVYVMHIVGAQTLLAGTEREDGAGPKQEALEAMAAGRHLTTLAYSERCSRSHFCPSGSTSSPSCASCPRSTPSRTPRTPPRRPKKTPSPG